MTSTLRQHTCDGTPENTFSILYANDPRQNLITKKISHSDVVKEFHIHCPVVARSAQPGQFVIVRGDDRGERVPLTIADFDREIGNLALVLQVVGLASHKLDELEAGDRMRDVVGPLGHKSEIDTFGTVVCVGGGLGIAPVFPIQRALKNAGNSVVSIIGARSKDLLFWEDRMRAEADEFIATTDDGSYGEKAFVNQPLRRMLERGVKIDRVIAIGPPVMMRAVAETTRPFGVKTIVSLNSIMIDGTGMCGGCRVEVGGKTRFTCVDGPEFDGHEVDFPMLLSRLGAYREQEGAAFREHRDREEMKVAKAPGRTPMPEQDPQVRAKNFDEVALGYTPDMARAEAARCLRCKKPFCVDGCPVNVDIPAFVAEIAEGRFVSAAKVLKRTNNLPAVCGRVCPQETQCEAKCILGKKGEPVAIGRLERFAADMAADDGNVSIPEIPASTGKRVAVIGSGPAGLTAGADLALLGHGVMVFEALHSPGGVLVYGIPEFRLPKAIVKRECDYLRELGVEFRMDYPIGPTITVPELLEAGFDAVFIGSGAGLPWFLDIPGENLKGVYSSNEILTRINLMKAYRFPFYDTPVLVGKNVCVAGGGNVAMDSARSMLRLGAESVTIVYRRTRNELPARAEEVHHALDEGVKLMELVAPVKLLGNDDGWLTGIECLKMELGEPDASGRRRPVELEGSEHVVPCDQLIVAIGNGPNPILTNSFPGLELDRRGNIPVNDGMMTNIPGVFAGGDIVTGAATVIEAMGAGKKAAAAIDRFLEGSSRPALKIR
ncbi:MAG: NADPH-dependent glutamate synthase [Planctomycetota bacterium]|jgi:glutamate synthase (NADPH/NADH) small chain|nr:NADPH-dependent glutamate synthase [Planctomycetota bacterium]